MDPRTFDTLIRKFSGTLSRRSLAAGSLGAAFLAAVGIDNVEARRQGDKPDVGAEACIPTGKKCPSPKPRGGRGGRRRRRPRKTLGCDKCCQRRSITKANGKQICYCAPQGEACTDTRECCDGRCLSGLCTLGGCPSPQTLCSDQCVNLQTDANNCGSCGRACPAGEVCSNGFTCQGAACLAVTGIEGNVTPAADGGMTATTEGSLGFGNLVFGSLPAGTTFANLAAMASDFSFATGTCGSGSPRFVVNLDNGRCPYAQFAAIPCAAQGNTGNLIGNDTPLVWNDDLCGGDPANDTYTEVLAAYGAIVISQIQLVVAESPPGTEQTVTLGPCVTLA